MFLPVSFASYNALSAFSIKLLIVSLSVFIAPPNEAVAFREYSSVEKSVSYIVFLIVPIIIALVGSFHQWNPLNGIFNLDQRLYGWYSLFVAVNSIPAGILCFLDGGFFNISMAIIWWLWGVLWLTGWIETVATKNLGKFVGYLSVFEGIVTAWIPGFMIIAGWWH